MLNLNEALKKFKVLTCLCVFGAQNVFAFLVCPHHHHHQSLLRLPVFSEKVYIITLTLKTLLEVKGQHTQFEPEG